VKGLNSPLRLSLSLIFLGIIFLGGITGCGSGEKGGTLGIGNGSVALFITDGPTEDFKEVNITINKISLLSDDLPPVVLYSGSRRINLLSLQDEQDLFMIHESVQAGVYHKIHLHISDSEFVPFEGEPISGDQIQLVANGKLDLVSKNGFHVIPGETLMIEVDMDAEKSILIHSTESQKYQFRPVFFVQVLNGLDSRMVALKGTIETISEDTEVQSFMLRRGHPFFHDSEGDSSFSDHESLLQNTPSGDQGSLSYKHDRTHLIQVEVPNGTPIFLENGLPGEFHDLQPGQRVFVRGFLKHDDHRRLHIHAKLIQIKSDLFKEDLRLRGEILEDIDSNLQFKFRPADGQGIVGDLVVQVHEQTMIVEAGTHRMLTTDALKAGKQVILKGVLDVTQDPVLFNAALIIVKPPELDQTRLEGSIQGEPDVDNRTFDLFEVIQHCPPPLGCPDIARIVPVHVLDHGVIVQITHQTLNDMGETHLGVEIIPFESLNKGDEVHLFGQFDSFDVFQAKVVVVEADY